MHNNTLLSCNILPASAEKNTPPESSACWSTGFPSTESGGWTLNLLYYITQNNSHIIGKQHLYNNMFKYTYVYRRADSAAGLPGEGFRKRDI